MTKSRKEEVLNNASNTSNGTDNDSATVNATKEEGAKVLEENLCRNLELMTNSFSEGAKHWLYIYYTSMFAFVLLAAYGFFLVYSLTSNVRRVADDMDQIVVSMNQITEDLDNVADNTSVMVKTMDIQSKRMHEIVYNMRDMNISMTRIRHDMSAMNHNVSRPMNFMNTFVPW